MADSSWGRQRGLSDGEEEDKIDPGEEEVAERERAGGEEDNVGWLRTAVQVLLPSTISAVVP
jgi:hypothetical protein